MEGKATNHDASLPDFAIAGRMRRTDRFIKEVQAQLARKICEMLFQIALKGQEAARVGVQEMKNATSLFKELIYMIPRDESTAQETAQLEDLEYECPSQECQVPDYWTLAACSECEEVGLSTNTSLDCTHQPAGANVSMDNNLKDLKAILKRVRNIEHRQALATCLLRFKTGLLDSADVSLYEHLNDTIQKIRFQDQLPKAGFSPLVYAQSADINLPRGYLNASSAILDIFQIHEKQGCPRLSTINLDTWPGVQLN
ncbi:hypothetical protein BDV96DRAFT_599234 [Lophiotrema nucula]|uniref:Uncharacterized protein n=1 Tax=Lophiotrema nucula TaxID=690887 RepID=A0A6A5Z9S0_9PLEO|nr:hypothetical protein BDV96DRAFT_599234 [Lophiotrema nucula]